MKNIFLIAIIVLLIVIVGILAFWVVNNSKQISEKGVSTELPINNEASVPSKLSEQPNKAKFDEYFTKAYLAKLPAGSEFDPWKIIETKTFTAGEKFCTSLTMKKQIPANTLSTAVYDVNAKLNIEPRGGTFPQALGPAPGESAGPTIGCESLTQSVGEYEYKIYLNDIVVIVLPFEVR